MTTETVDSNQRPLRLFTDNVEYVIAHDVQDARRIWCEFTGEEACAIDFEEVPVTERFRLALWVKWDGKRRRNPPGYIVTEPHEEGAAARNFSRQELIVQFGRGWLCSTEY